MAKDFVSNIQKQHMFCKKLRILHTLKEKSKSGSKCRANFLLLGRNLSPVDYQEFSWKPNYRSVGRCNTVIVLKGCWFANEMGKVELLHLE
jgi:hypothetical protein